MLPIEPRLPAFKRSTAPPGCRFSSSCRILSSRPPSKPAHARRRPQVSLPGSAAHPRPLLLFRRLSANSVQHRGFRCRAIPGRRPLHAPPSGAISTALPRPRRRRVSNWPRRSSSLRRGRVRCPAAQGPAGDAGHPGALLEVAGERQHLEGLLSFGLTVHANSQPDRMVQLFVRIPGRHRRAILAMGAIVCATLQSYGRGRPLDPTWNRGTPAPRAPIASLAHDPELSANPETNGP